MIEIGKSASIEVVCVLTNMSIPLGTNVGNMLEVKEAMDILKDGKEGPLQELCIELSSQMVSLGLNTSYEDALKMVKDSLSSGRAYRKFLELVKSQGGLFRTLVASCRKVNVGFDILSCREVRIDSFLFGEESGRLLSDIQQLRP